MTDRYELANEERLSHIETASEWCTCQACRAVRDAHSHQDEASAIIAAIDTALDRLERLKARQASRIERGG